jgi:hypothetical protein
MKKIIYISLIILLSCGKENGQKNYAIAGLLDDNINYFDLNPNVDLDAYIPGQFDFQIDGKRLIAIGAITVNPIQLTTAEVSCERIFIERLGDSHTSPPIIYTYATGNMKAYDINNTINDEELWTNSSWTCIISIDRRYGWTVGEKNYIGFRYRKDSHFLYGWIGIIITDTTTLTVDDYAFQKN